MLTGSTTASMQELALQMNDLTSKCTSHIRRNSHAELHLRKLHYCVWPNASGVQDLKIAEKGNADAQATKEEAHATPSDAPFNRPPESNKTISLISQDALQHKLALPAATSPLSPRQHMLDHDGHTPPPRVLPQPQLAAAHNVTDQHQVGSDPGQSRCAQPHSHRPHS